MATCPRCGVENKPGKAACWNCWAPIEGRMGGAAPLKQAARAERFPRPQPATGFDGAAQLGNRASERVGPRPFPYGKAAAIVVILAIIALALYFFVFSRGGGPERVVGDFLEAWKTGDQAKVRQLAASSAKELAGQQMEMVTITDYQVGTATVQDDTATVPVTLQIQLSSKFPEALRKQLQPQIDQQLGKGALSIICIKEEGQWRVERLQPSGAQSGGGPAMPSGQPGPPGAAPMSPGQPGVPPPPRGPAVPPP